MLAAAVLVVCAAVQCAPKHDIRIIKSEISAFDFGGFSDIDIGVKAKVFNGYTGFSLSNISGAVMWNDKAICRFTAEPFDIEARDTCIVKTTAHLGIERGTDFLSIYSMIREKNLSRFTLNWEADVSKGIFKKRISGEGIPLSDFIKL